MKYSNLRSRPLQSLPFFATKYHGHPKTYIFRGVLWQITWFLPGQNLYFSWFLGTHGKKTPTNVLKFHQNGLNLATHQPTSPHLATMIRCCCRQVWEIFPEIQLWQQLRTFLLKKRQIHGRFSAKKRPLDCYGENDGKRTM